MKNLSRERWQEMFALPEHVLKFHQDAYEVEFMHYILECFAFDMSAMDNNDRVELYTRFVNELAISGEPTNKTSACRTFARFVDENGGADDFAVDPADVEKWLNHVAA